MAARLQCRLRLRSIRFRRLRSPLRIIPVQPRTTGSFVPMDRLRCRLLAERLIPGVQASRLLRSRPQPVATIRLRLQTETAVSQRPLPLLRSIHCRQLPSASRKPPVQRRMTASFVPARRPHCWPPVVLHTPGAQVKQPLPSASPQPVFIRLPLPMPTDVPPRPAQPL